MVQCLTQLRRADPTRSSPLLSKDHPPHPRAAATYLCMLSAQRHRLLLQGAPLRVRFRGLLLATALRLPEHLGRGRWG
ncbi:hypothetical protein P7K49_013251 [Saguinus oedipus]|uniref:Uncharacterized protein n=1 Tax=Saguinus oedipus TaxID=9490 RepID=A0ABQ9VFC9_SAGOE|nr:hypothetical protein P7K49_013251 [Saguinus oedipus]